MYPILFRIGNFPINTYGVFLALAFLGEIFVTVRLAERDGLPREKIYDLCLWLLLSSLIGSKVLMFLTEPEYREHPLQLFSLDFLRSGGVFYGGLIGAVLTGYFLMKRYKLPWWKTADACAPGVAIGNFFGRQGCFSAGNRFAIEFVRDDPGGDILGLTTLTGLSTSQMISIIVGGVALTVLIIRWRKESASAKANPLVAATAARA